MEPTTAATTPSLPRDSSATPPSNFQDPALHAYRAKHHRAYLERKRREVLAHGGTIGLPTVVRSSDVNTKSTGTNEVKSETIHRSTMSSTVATAVPSPTWKPSAASSDPPKGTPTTTTISSHNSKGDARTRRSGTRDKYLSSSSTKPLGAVASSPNLSSHGQTKSFPPTSTVISRRVIDSSTQPCPSQPMATPSRPHSKSHIGTSHIGTSHIGTSHIGTSHIGTSHTATSHIGTSHTGTSHTGTSHTGTSHTGTSPPSLSTSSENWTAVPTISPQPAPTLPAKHNTTYAPSGGAGGGFPQGAQGITTMYSAVSPERPRRTAEQPTSSSTTTRISQLKKNAREIGLDTHSGFSAETDQALAKALQEEEDARLARELAERESRAGDDSGVADYISKHGVRPPDREFTERLIPDHATPTMTGFATSLGVEIPATTAVGDPANSTYPRTSTVYRYDTASHRSPNGNNFNAMPGTTTTTRLRPFNQQPTYPSKSTVIRRSAYGETQPPTNVADPMTLWNSLAKRANGAGGGGPSSTRVRDASRNGLMGGGESMSFEQAPTAYRPFGSSSNRSASSGRDHSSPSLQTPSPPAPSSGEPEMDEEEQLRLTILESERVYRQEQARRR